MDVKIPFPNVGFVAKTHDANVGKYMQIKKKYEKKYTEVLLLTIIIPSVGPNIKFSHLQLQQAGFASPESIKILREMSGAAAIANFQLATTMPAGGAAYTPKPPNQPEILPTTPPSEPPPPPEIPFGVDEIVSRLRVSPPSPSFLAPTREEV